MPVMFDRKKLNELVDRESRLRAETSEWADKLQQQRARDTPFSKSDMDAYVRDSLAYSNALSALHATSAEAAQLRLWEPKAARRSFDAPVARWFRNGPTGLATDERELFCTPKDTWKELANPMATTFTLEAVTRSDNSTGEQLVQETVAPAVVERLAYYGSAASVAQKFNTETGNDFNVPGLDSTAQKGRLTTQGGPRAKSALPDFTAQTFKAWTMESQGIPLTLEVINDAVFDLESYVYRAILNRLGRGWNEQFTTGDNSNKPWGMVSCATAGVTGSSASTITLSEIINLRYAVPRAYRYGYEGYEGGYMAPSLAAITATQGVSESAMMADPRMLQAARSRAIMEGMVGYMISDQLEREIRKLVDGDMRPLWQPGVALGDPDTINGWPYIVNGDMADPARSAVSMLFGNFGYYGCRQVASVQVYRFFDSQTYEDNGATVFHARNRRDGRPLGAIVNSTCEAIAKFTHAAS